MRKLGVVSSVLIAAFTASLAHASTWEFGLKAGAAFPMGDLGDFVSTGFSGGVFADYMMSPQMGFGADIAGDFFSGSDFPDPVLVGVSHDVKFDVLQYGVHGIYNFSYESGKMSPFILYGLAMYNGKTKVDDLNIDDSSTKFGLNGGLGVNFGGSETMKFGVEGEYHYIFLDKEKDFSSSASYIRVLARLTFLTAGTTTH